MEHPGKKQIGMGFVAMFAMFSFFMFASKEPALQSWAFFYGILAILFMVGVSRMDDD